MYKYLTDVAKIITYPDGQVNVDIQSPCDYISYRINSYTDLMIVKLYADAYQSLSNYPLHFSIPCLFGQRSDRKFTRFESFGLKAITDIINSCNFASVEVFDPHSDVSLALINNSEKVYPDKYIKEALKDCPTGTILVSPDAGAYKKVFSLAETLNTGLVAANKFRDNDGTISLNISGNCAGKDFLILDDILDGGWTFVLLSKKLKELGANSVSLYVSHAYFSQGYDCFPDINMIYCTNSVRDHVADNVTCFNIFE